MTLNAWTSMDCTRAVACPHDASLRRRSHWKRLSLCGVFIVFTVSSAPRVFADHLVGQLQFFPRGALMVPRDPEGFLAGLERRRPRPAVLLSLEDAVTRELLRRNQTMNEVDVLRAAQALCDEANSLGFDPLLLLAVIHVESYYNHLAISEKGAEGLMQLMPETAAWVAGRSATAWSDGHSFDPALNVRLGARYLAHLVHRYRQLPEALTAYNRGPKATDAILARHHVLPGDISDFYADKVMERYHMLRRSYGNLPMG
jgi:hypothetical protein